MSEGYVQISLHSHCKTCIRTDCNVLPDDVNCCQIVNCKYRCPLKFHRCKEFQHKKFCRNVEVPCLNRAYGCHQEFPRGKMSEHLPHCNASVIYINDQDIRRSDYFWYAKNVLEDLGGKTLQNYGDSCPYAFAGCDFTYKHFEPEGNRKVVYSDWLNAVGLQITGNDSQPSETNAEILDTKGQRSELPGDAVGTENLGSRLESLGINEGEDKTSKRKSVKNFSRQSSLALCRSLSQEQQGQYTGLLLLPPELIQKITGYLDGFSLCNLSVTCLFFRDICSLILVDKGIVSPTWTKLDSIKGMSEGTSQDTDGQRLDTKWTMPDGSVKDKKWVVKHMSWRFSKTFEPVRRWDYQGAQQLLLHLQNCPYKTESCLNISKEPFSYEIRDSNVKPNFGKDTS